MSQSLFLIFKASVRLSLRTSKLTTHQTRPRAFSTTGRLLQIFKISPSPLASLQDLQPHSTLLVGGFGLSGVPNTLLRTIRSHLPHATSLTVASNNAGTPTHGLGLLLQSRQIRRMIASYIGENHLFERQYLDGDIDLELTPQGTLAERCRAAGAGIPAFYTPAAVGTVVASGDLPVRFSTERQGQVESFGRPKDVRVFDGRSFVLEEAIRADFALVKAWRADRLGNLQFRYASQNFNGVMARAARVTVAEAEEIVEPGEIPPGAVHVPGIYVTRVVRSEEREKPIEKVVNAKQIAAPAPPGADVRGEKDEAAGRRNRIIRRAAREFEDGTYANLGIGLPTLATSFIPPNVSVTLQSENGILGLGPYPARGEEDPDLINAGKETVTLAPGASTFGSEESFGMIRGGRIDLALLGAMQVSEKGDLANWMLPGRIKGFGGAMDLVSNPSGTRVVVVTEHVDKKGRAKIKPLCDFPLTGTKCVSRVITDLCVFDIDFTSGLTLVELAEGVTLDEVRSKTAATFNVADHVRPMFS